MTAETFPEQTSTGINRGDHSVSLRVGKFNASAQSNEAVLRFTEMVLSGAQKSVEDPIRLLIMPHLCNAIAQTIPSLPASTRILLDGFVCELVSAGHLRRLGTMSKQSTAYHAIYSQRSRTVVEDGIELIREALHSNGRVLLSDAKQLLDGRLSHRTQNVIILLGHFAYRGEAMLSGLSSNSTTVISLPNA